MLALLFVAAAVANAPRLVSAFAGNTTYCTACSAVFPGDTVVSTCSDAAAAVAYSSATCEDIRDSSCACCGFCNKEAQYDDYTTCENGASWCNFCTASEYAEQPIFDTLCTDQPKSWIAALLLTLFLGEFGAGYFYYGYGGLGAAMLVLFFVMLFVGVMLLCCRIAAGNIPIYVGACVMYIWALVLCGLIGVTQFLPASDDTYEFYCPITCMIEN